MPRLIAVRVVSFPATASRMKNGAISCGARMSSSSVGVHERGGEVVARVLAALLGELVHQRRELHARFEHRRHRVAPAEHVGVAGAEDDVGRVEHRAELAARDAHHVADDQQRERLRERLDEVDLALLAHAVDHLAADRLDRFEHRRELSRRERARHDAALASVARVVHVDERPEELQRLRRQVGDRHRARARSRSPRAGG